MEALLEAWWPEAYRIAFGVLRNRSEAQDAAQDACSIVYRRLSTLRSIDRHRAWLYRIVVRCAQETAKKQRRLGALLDAVACPQPESHIDDRLDVGNALDNLQHDVRTLVLLRYYADFTSKEIGEIMNMPSATVRFRLAIARKRLRNLLSQPHPWKAIDEAREHA